MKRAGSIRKSGTIQGSRLLSIKGGAAYSGLTVWALRERIWAGHIPFVRFPSGRKMYIDRRDLDELIERNKQTMK